MDFTLYIYLFTIFFPRKPWEINGFILFIINVKNLALDLEYSSNSKYVFNEWMNVRTLPSLVFGYAFSPQHTHYLNQEYSLPTSTYKSQANNQQALFNALQKASNDFWFSSSGYHLQGPHDAVYLSQFTLFLLFQFLLVFCFLNISLDLFTYTLPICLSRFLTSLCLSVLIWTQNHVYVLGSLP